MKPMAFEKIHPKMVWQYIKADIESRIIKGELNGGDKAPSIAEISGSYGVSKSTGQKVLEHMADDGTIIRRKGSGFYVKPYMKEKLRQSHMEKLDFLIEEVRQCCTSLNMSEAELLNLLFPHGED